MMANDIIAVRGNLYCYDKFDEDIQMHKVAEVEIDEEGFLICTYRPGYFTDEDLKDNEISFTPKQWRGLVEFFIRDGYPDLDEDDVLDAAEDIVGRCFAHGVPKFENLEEYIAEYMNR